MYKVLESFTTLNLTGTYGQVISIDDKELADSLKAVGYITPVSKKDQAEANKEKKINELEKENNTLKEENISLKKQLEDLNSLLESATSLEETSDDDDKKDGVTVTENDDSNEFIKDNQEDEESKDLNNK